MKQVKQLFQKIAREHLAILTLKSRKSDSLDFHTVSVWAVESALKAAFDAGCKSAESEYMDMHDLAAKRKQIVIIWSVEDVQEVRPDLTDEQAWNVLQRADRGHDATLGICWETLEYHAESLFGDAPESDEAYGAIMKLHIECVQRHRNGISGAPFYVLVFLDPNEGRMLGIVFEQAYHVAVFNLDKLAQGDIAFGSNSWRGDQYEPCLRQGIANHETKGE